MIHTPREVLHVSVFVAEELEARGWTIDDLVERMGGDDVTALAVDMIFLKDDRLILGELAEQLGQAFGTGPELWRRLDAAWRASKTCGNIPPDTP